MCIVYCCCLAGLDKLTFAPSTLVNTPFNLNYTMLLTSNFIQLIFETPYPIDRTVAWKL